VSLALRGGTNGLAATVLEQLDARERGRLELTTVLDGEELERLAKVLGARGLAALAEELRGLEC
jgi:DNA-binding PucR family transcriptional regulator